MRAAQLLALATLALATPAYAAPLWPQSRGDASNSAATEISAPRSATPESWTFAGSGRVWGYEPGMTVWSDPALALVDGTALLAIGSYDHNLYCLDAATGALRWKLTTGGPVYSAPAIASHAGVATLYATSTDRLIYAVDASSGRQRWVHSVHDYQPTLGGARLSAPVFGQAAGDDAIFVGHWVWDSSLTNNFQHGGLTAVRASDGKPIWTTRLGDNQLTAPLYARSGDQGWLFIGSKSGTLYAVDADSGAVLWQRAELDSVRSPPAFVMTRRGPLVIAASKFGAVRGREAATGDEVWSYKTGDRITGSPAIYSRDATPIAIVGSYDRHLYAIDATSGAKLWSYAARGGIYSSPALLSAGKRQLALASAWDHALHGVDLRDGSTSFILFTGRPLWNIAGMDDSNWSSPVAARINGIDMAFVGSYDGSVHALTVDGADGRRPPPRSNRRFWLSFPIVLIPFAAFAILLTRRDRRRRR